MCEEYWRLDNVDIMAEAAREIEHEAALIEMYLEDDVPLSAVSPDENGNYIVDLDADEEQCDQSIRVLSEMLQEKMHNAKVVPSQAVPAENEVSMRAAPINAGRKILPKVAEHAMVLAPKDAWQVVKKQKVVPPTTMFAKNYA